MGSSHSHQPVAAPSAGTAAVRRRASLMLAAVLVPLALATIIGMIVLWPSGEGTLNIQDPYATSEGVTFDVGRVQYVSVEDCPSSAPTVEAGGTAQQCTVAYTQPEAGGSVIPVEMTPEVIKAHGVEAGDQIRYLNLQNVMQGGAAPYVFVDFVRTAPMLLLAVLYAVVVCLVARWRGFRAMLGLIGAFLVISQFILPGLVEGRPPLLLGLVGSVVIMFAVLYFAHGFSARTSTALLGTLFGLGITALLAAWATDSTYLTGVGDENAYMLINASEGLSFTGIVMCGLIISGLGVLNDVTITQSSAVWELYELAPRTSVRELFTSAMRIGRDHIASTVYTIAFAYAGAALPVLILVSMYERPLMSTLTSGELAEEIVRTLVGSVGLVLAIPVTTIIAVLVVKSLGIPAGADPAAAGAAAPAAAAAGLVASPAAGGGGTASAVVPPQGKAAPSEPPSPGADGR